MTRTGETGSWLGQGSQGQGIGTLMRQAICVLCLDHLGFAEVTSGAFATTPPRSGVSRKVGYRRRRRASGWRRKGAVATNVQLLLTPDDLVRPPYDVEVSGRRGVPGAGRAGSGARDVEPVVLVPVLQPYLVGLGLDVVEDGPQRVLRARAPRPRTRRPRAHRRGAATGARR